MYTDHMIMPLGIVPSFLLYCVTMGITPGPANLCSLAAAIQHGRKPALRQWSGLLTGFYIDAIVSALLCYFAGTVLNESVKYLSVAGCFYLVFLAVKMLKADYSRSPENPENGEDSVTKDSTGRGPNFWTGFLVNVTNAKVILSCLTELGAFVLPYNQSLWALLLIGACLPLIGTGCNLVWLFTGVALRRFFMNHTKTVNILMALSLLACAVSLLSSVFH